MWQQLRRMPDRGEVHIFGFEIALSTVPVHMWIGDAPRWMQLGALATSAVGVGLVFVGGLLEMIEVIRRFF
jgi:hypothetical protein